MLECIALGRRYGRKTAVSDLNLMLDAGKIHVLLGENGSGKTTFLKMAAGLLRPSRGQILFQGHPLSWQDRVKISWLSTEPIFYDYMRVSDVEQYYADFFPDFDRERFSVLTQKLGLTDNPKVRNLSSGSGAKLRIAAALSRRAELFLLDEPMGGIDYKAREEIISLILETADDTNTFVISTHLLDEIESFADRALFLKEGRLICDVNPEAERERTGRSIAELYRKIM